MNRSPEKLFDGGDVDVGHEPGSKVQPLDEELENNVSAEGVVDLATVIN